MEGDLNPDQLINPEKKANTIPFFKPELSPSIDLTAQDAVSVLNCFKGYNYLADLYNSGSSEEELSSLMPTTYAIINQAIYPKLVEENVTQPKIEIPEVDITKGGEIQTIEIKDQLQLKTMLIQARTFTHGLGNMANAVIAIQDINDYLEEHGADDKDDTPEPLDIRERLKTNLIHAQELLSDKLLFEQVNAMSLGDGLGSYMRTILGRDNVDVAVMQDLDPKLLLDVPIYWLNVLAADLAQNIQRKQERDGKKLQTLILISKDPVTGMLHIKVEDNGAPYPQEYVDNGFERGKGENEGGKHIAMAAHSETAKKQGGRIYASNEYDEEEDMSYAQTNILLPLNYANNSPEEYSSL